MEGLQAADTREAFSQRVYVTQEHKQYHVGAHVTKCDQGREEDILLPSYGAQCNLSAIRTPEKGW